MKANIVFASVVGLSMITAFSAHADDVVNSVLKIKLGCYPISYEITTDKIGIVCRGEKNWTPEGATLYSDMSADKMFSTSVQTHTSLNKDMSNGIGPANWFTYYFALLDKYKIPRPQ